MRITEAIHVQVLLAFLFEGDSEAARTGAEEAAGVLAERARRVLGTGPTGVEAVARFARVFPPGWWELPPADTTGQPTDADVTGEAVAGGGP